MNLLLPYLPPFVVTLIANLGEKQPRWRTLAYVLLAIFNGLVFLSGAVLVTVSMLLRLARAPASSTLGNARFMVLGFGVTVAAALALACLARPVRRVLARWLPLDPESPVHATALVFMVYLTTSSLAALLSGDNLLGSGMDPVRVDPVSIVLGQVAFLAFALAGVGLGLRRSVRQVAVRLGLQRLTRRYLVMGVAVVGAFLILDYATAMLWYRLWPSNYETVMQTSERMFAGFSSPLGALVLALAAGIGEEMLFRGALQPRFGLPITALVFTMGHVQYGLSPAIVEILIIGCVLGWLRRRANTTTCVFVHAVYNFIDVFIVPLFP